MQILHPVTMDMVRKLPMTPIRAVQNDANSRAVAASLLENGSPWVIPGNITAAVAFRKGDGSRGLYDRLPDGATAITINGSTVTAILAPQVLSCPGGVDAAIVFFDGSLNRVAAFPFSIDVDSDPSAGQGISNDYYRFSTMEQVSDALEDFLAKAEEALEVVHDTAAQDAPAIVCQAVGDVITVSDAAHRPLQGLSIYGKTTQNGTPTPSAPIPLESVGESIVVRITDAAENNVQTLTASAPNGLCRIDETKDGKFVKTHRDEIDFARGVRVKRTHTIVLDGTENFVKEAPAMTMSLPYPCIDNINNVTCICSHYQSVCRYQLISQKDVADFQAAATNVGNLRFLDNVNFPTGDAESFKAWLAQQYAKGTPVTVTYVLATPIETPLSAEELAQFATVHTNKPNTTVCNDAGADLSITYVADTKTYMDDRCNELADGIVSGGGSGVGGYILTEADKQEIAELAAQMVDFPGGGGSGGLNITDDGNGNVTIETTGSVTITDDGNGNVTIV